MFPPHMLKVASHVMQTAVYGVLEPKFIPAFRDETFHLTQFTSMLSSFDSNSSFIAECVLAVNVQRCRTVGVWTIRTIAECATGVHLNGQVEWEEMSHNSIVTAVYYDLMLRYFDL